MIDKLEKFENNKSLKKGFYVLACLSCVFVFYSYVKAPYTGDIQVFMAAANQVKYQPDGGLLGVFESWELKGIANRTLIYIVYRLTKLFVDYGRVVGFEEVSKCIYGMGTTAVLLISACLIPAKTERKIHFFFITFLTIFASFTAVHMQAEMSAVILCFLILALILHGGKWSYITAGVLGSFLFFFKSIFFLLFFSTLAAVFLTGRGEGIKSVLSSRATTGRGEDRKKYFLSLASMAISEIVLILAVKKVYPQEFTDMGEAAEFQDTLFSVGSAVSLNQILDRLSNGFTKSSVAIPFILFGAFSAVLLLIRFVKRRQWDMFVALVVLWLLPIDIIAASNMYFIYHYFLLALPSAVCIYCILDEEKIHWWQWLLSALIALAVFALCQSLLVNNVQTGLVNYSSVLLVIIHLFIIAMIVCCIPAFRKAIPLAVVCVLAVGLFFWINYSSSISPKTINMRVLSAESENCFQNAIPDDFGDEPVLFMDAGVVPFYCDAPSYSRYFFNLPLQRWKEHDDWEVQRTEYEKVMSYDGKYIVFTGWFEVKKYPELQEKINNEYERLESGGLYTFAPNWDVFKLIEEPNLDQIYKKSETYIMVRKE